MSPVAPAIAATLSGLQLVEASAGTGKTWTIAGLFLRLVAERGVPVDGVLTVTFTRAATAELRERIRDRLHAVAEALADDAPEGAAARLCAADPVAARLLQERPAETVRQRCEVALRNFDAAPIFTIHGFCQRALSDRALSAGIAFDAAMAADVGDWVRALVEDFWRRRVTGAAPGSLAADPRFLCELQRRQRGPAALLRWLGEVLNKAGMEVREPPPVDIRPALDTLGARHAALAAAWPETRPDIDLLLRSIGGARYRVNHIDGRLQAMDEWLAGGDPLGGDRLLDKLAYFHAQRIRECRKGADDPLPAWILQFTELCDDCEVIRDAFDAEWRRLRVDLLESARRELPVRMLADRVQGFDALLGNLHAALHGVHGDALAAALRQRYPAALVDEFQDTDTLQWGILGRIYADADPAAICAFLVGDPKQAIYSFRGADVQAYLGAVQRCGARHELVQNQRSVAALVDALNRVYARRADAFREPRIAYVPVQASPRPKAPLSDDDGIDVAPLRLVRPFDDAGDKADESAWVAAGVAGEIARLLAGAAAGRVRLGDRALCAGDIAVLVNRHAQGLRVRDALAARGIASAQQSNQSVFHSQDAEQLERVLLAIAQPQRTAWLRAALATDYFGLDGHRLLRLGDDEDALQRWLDAFAEWQQRWRTQGFMRMFAAWLRDGGVIARLAARSDGERRLTNLFHLAELTHAERARHTTPGALIAWLAARRADGRGEAAELRLESDAALVQIVTIHRAKGLEYPVVFAPYLWDANAAKAGDDIVLFHDPSPPHGWVLDASGRDLDAARRRAQDEALAEQLRLAYVALTRARNRCYVHTSTHACVAHSALGWLLHGIETVDAEGAPLKGKALQEMVAERVPEDLSALQREGNGCIRAVDLDTAMSAPPVDAPAGAPLTCARLPRPLPGARVTTSFTALLRLIEPGSEPAADHDQAGGPRAVAPPTADIAHAFPRGAEAGVCLHALFEHIDFTASAPSWRPVVQRELAASGYTAQPVDAVGDWLARCVDAPLLDDGLRLRDIPRDRQLRELAFQLPLAGLAPARLTDTLRVHGWPVSPLAGSRIDGYLRGFVDLVFCSPRDRRWWIVDYKSNALGGDDAAYTPAALERAMADADYPLQAALYLLALHRWLRARLPGYQPARDLGGALYLFIRGLSPQAPGRGVHRLDATPALLDALDALAAPARPLRLAEDGA